MRKEGNVRAAAVLSQIEIQTGGMQSQLTFLLSGGTKDGEWESQMGDNFQNVEFHFDNQTMPMETTTTCNTRIGFKRTISVANLA